MVDFQTITMIFQIFLLTSCIYYSDSQTLNLCGDKNDGDPCLLSCQTADVNQVITISKSPSYTALGSCLVGGSCFSADTSRYNVSQTDKNTNFEIFSFEKSDNATWRCEYTGNTPDDVFMSWSKLPTSINELSVINSNVTITDELVVSVEVGCLYSLQDPIPKLKLMCGGASVTSYHMPFSPSTSVCSDPDLSAYICNYTLTSTPPSQSCNSGYTGYGLRVVVNLVGTSKTYEKDIFASFSVSFESEVTTEGSTEGTSTTTQSITTQTPKPKSCDIVECTTLVGIVAGAVSFVAILIIIIYCYMKKRYKN